MKQARGYFITLEGGEGCGKTTNISAIQTFLENQGITVLTTREPGGTLLGDALRTLLLSPDTGQICDDAELLMMFAARAQHVHHVIQPALAKGQWVISDRFTDSSYAYQGFARGIPEQRIDQLAEWVLGSFQPDLTFYLDIDPLTGLDRARERSEPDRFETEKSDFYARVRQGFLHRAARSPDRFRLIDASQPLEGVQADILQHLSAFVNSTSNAN